jgi:ribosomal protein S18 acetylase RimI-like enzyme
MKNIIEYTNKIKELIQSESKYLNISDVDSYTNKIINNADFVIEEDKGFIAYYANDFTSKKAYITMVIIDKKYRGKQIGKKLLLKVLNDLRGKGFLSVQLEVDKYNRIAYNLYSSFGFFKIDESDKKIKMETIL